MRRVEIVSLAALGVSVISSVVGLLQTGAAPVVLALPVLAAGVWLFGRYTHRTWPITIATAGLILLALYTVLAEADTLSGVLAVIATVIASDLNAFRARLRQVDRVVAESQLVNAHLLRLGILSVLALLLFLATTLINLDLGVWTALFLSLLLFFGLSRAVTYLRRESS